LPIYREPMKTVAAIICFFLLAIAQVGSADPADNRQPVSFVPQWIPQAQFAGYYVALEKGFFQKFGLEVNILRGGPERPSAEWLKKGAVDFGTMFLTTAIVERARGTRLVNIGQIISRSSQVLIAKKSSGIKTWRDMNGKKAGLWGAELSIMPMAVFRKYGLGVTVITQSLTVNLFLRGGVDLVSAMLYNEYHAILAAGVEPEELAVFRLSDVGFNLPEDGIYCLESKFKKDPQTCCRFVQASLEGWRYAFDHPEEALDIVMKYVEEAKTATNRQHQKWMLEHMRELIDLPAPGEKRTQLSESDYMAVAGELRANGLIDDIPSFSDFHGDCGGVNEK
jgi:NitT/TauT family transport system substrate-binding protein